MGKTDIEIRYDFACDDGTTREFTVVLDPATLTHRLPQHPNPPVWTRLDKSQCEFCPLGLETEHCPVALSLAHLVDAFDGMISFSEVEVTVTTPQRQVTRRTSAQKALSSLVGLYMATSACPSMAFLKPMARFHLPFSTREETLFRVAGTYLLSQYYLHQQGIEPDWNMTGLSEAYKRLHWVNMSLAHRLRHAFQGDANLNALVLLDLFAQEMPAAIDEQLRELRYLFKPFLQDGAPHALAQD